MAKQFHVQGPTTISFGTLDSETELGQTDGETLVTFEEVTPTRPVTTDESGGQPNDYLVLQPHCPIILTLINWDDAVLENMVGRPVSATTFPTSVGAWGEAGTVGLLMDADANMKQSLKIEGNKVYANNGGLTIQFPKCMRDPEIPVRWTDLGSDLKKVEITMRAFPDDNSPNPRLYIRTENT